MNACIILIQMKTNRLVSDISHHFIQNQTLSIMNYITLLTWVENPIKMN